MITAYLTGIASQYEGEDIEVRYSIYENEEHLSKKTMLLGYKKPALVGLVSLSVLLKKVVKYKDQEIAIVINDAALYELIQGSSTTKNQEVLKMAREIREELATFRDCVIKDVSGEHIELTKWYEEVRSKL